MLTRRKLVMGVTLSLLALPSVITACTGTAPRSTALSSTPSPSTKGTASTSVPAATAKPVSGTVTITLWSHWGDPVFWKIQKQIDAAIMARHPGLQVVDNPSTDQYNAKLAAAAAAGTLPDLFKLQGEQVQRWIKDAFVLPLDERISATAGFDLADFFDFEVALYRANGKLYGLPYDHGSYMLWYNQDMFDQAGVEAPSANWTLDDMRAAMVKLTKPGQQWGGAGGFVLQAGPSLQGSFLKPFGGALVNDAETATEVDSPKSIQAMQWWADLRLKDKVVPMPEDLVGGAAGIGDIFSTGRAALDIEGAWIMPTLNQQAKFNWNVAPFPKGPAGQVTSSMGSGYLMTKDTKNPDQAWNYLGDFMSKDKDMLEYQLAISARGTPARKSVWPALEKSSSVPSRVKMQIIYDALNKYSVLGRPVSPPTPKIYDALTKQFDLLWLRQKTVPEIAQATQIQITPLLAENHG